MNDYQQITGMFNQDGRVICPRCSFEYVRAEHPLYFAGNDEYEAEKVFEMGVRGDVIALPFCGECGHKWIIALGSHKGNTRWKLVPDTRE